MKMNILSYFMSTIALALYCGSYFFNNKKKYLVLQLTGNVEDRGRFCVLTKSLVFDIIYKGENNAKTSSQKK